MQEKCVKLGVLNKRKKSKYFNIKSKGSDSKIEVKRYNELLLMEKAGEIRDISKQPRFILQGSFKYKDDKIKEKQIAYTADFKYFDIKQSVWIIEELKSEFTAKITDYVLRRKLFKNKYKDDKTMKFIEIVYDKK